MGERQWRRRCRAVWGHGAMISSLVGYADCFGDVLTAEFEGWHGGRVDFVKSPSLEPFGVWRAISAPRSGSAMSLRRHSL
eukprot:3384224-Prymnesium_polylepis.1